MPNLPSDAVLIAQLRDPNELDARQAFSLLYVAYCAPLCEWAYYLTHDHSAAEEAVSDVLARLWQRRHTWAPGDSIEAYLYGAVRLQIREDARNRNRRATLTQYFVPTGESPAMSTPIAAPDVAAQSNDTQRLLAHALATLSGRARAAVVYRWYDGLEFSEIAERLGTTEGAVRVLISRALKTLRDALPER